MAITQVPTDINSRNYTICTSSTRPASPIEGWMIYETDTDRIYVYDGSAWGAIAGPHAWTAVSFTNSWTDFGSGYQTAKYRKIGDIVYVRGVIKSGTFGAAAFTLPAGSRPSLQEQFTARDGAGFAYLDVSTGGAVVPNGSNNTAFSFSFQFSITA